MERAPDADPLIATCAESVEMGLTDVADWLVDMERDIGVRATLRFLRAYAGQDAYIPENGAAVGDPNAVAKDWLLARLGWGRISIPMGPMARRTRNAWITLRMLRDGASLSSIGRELGVSLRTVCTIKNRLAARGLLPPLSEKEGLR